MNQLKIREVRSFWEAHPLCASVIPYPSGTREYFDYYDRLREENETLQFSYWLHEYRRFVGRRVLDVGSGNGYVLSKYAQEGAEVAGIDITEAGIDLCRKRFASFGLTGHFVVGNAEELPFESDTFDCVCSMGVLHHTVNAGKAVNEIYRVLKPGGKVILMVYHRNSALYRFKLPVMRFVTGKSTEQLLNEVDGVGNPKSNVFSKNEFRRLLDEFKDLRIFVGLLQSWMLFPMGGRLLSDRLLKYFEKYLGWFLYAKARKL